VTSAIHAAFQSVLRELIELQKPSSEAAARPIFPGLIPVGSEGSLIVNDEIEKQIHVIAKWLLDQRPTGKAQHTLKEWRHLVRNSFGPAIMQLDLDDGVEDNARKLKNLVEARIDSEPRIVSSKFTSMGCLLFDQPIAASLLMGPVSIEPKADWLKRAERVGQISADVHERLKHAFDGHPLEDASDPKQRLFERSIREVLENAQLVCTVETQMLAPEMGESRAIIGARMALTSIALLWRMPSRVLEGFHLSVDHGHRQIKTIPFVPGQQWIGGSRLKGLPFGPHMPATEWSTIEREARGLLDLAGNMIACWTSVPAYDQASPLLRNLAQALFFVGEACREENDLMAIVKFTGALEALAQGKSSAIEKLASTRLGMKAQDKVVGERTIGEVVKWIYSTGRSRTLHGNNPDILHDWGDARAVAESLTRYCLVASMEWLNRNPGATDAKALLS